MSLFIQFVNSIKYYKSAKNKFIKKYFLVHNSSRIYRIGTLSIFYILMPCFSLQSKIPNKEANLTLKKAYVGWHSLATYFYRNPSYTSYEPVTDIKKNGCNWGTWVTFPQKIEAIQAQVGNISRPIELFRSKDFLIMYKHPGYYWQSFLDYIVDSRYSLDQKKISIYAMREYYSPFGFFEKFYELYKKKAIDLAVLELWVAINLVNNYSYGDPGKANADFGNNLFCELQTIQNNIPKDSSLYKDLSSILLDNIWPNSWEQYRMHTSHAARVYYNRQLPFYATLVDAVRDIHYLKSDYPKSGYSRNLAFGLDTHPYFLMAVEHPMPYCCTFGAYGRSMVGKGLKEYSNVADILCDKEYTDEEKSMAIFSMSQLGVREHESFYYGNMLERSIESYKQGSLSLHHLSQFFKSDLNIPFKYSFFILDYKDNTIQNALAKLIAEPTIPEAIKVLAHKVKEGTLATKEEMEYMEGYRTFRKTHFTLYETVVPRGA